MNAPQESVAVAPSSSRSLGLELLTLLGFCAFLFFYGLGSFGLVGADEPRYAQIAREMLRRNDWVTPILNGQPWLEKPILYYWGAMLSYRAFGVSDWAARVPSAVLATLMVLGTYFFFRRFRRGFQLDAALMAATSAGVGAFARAASTDMPLAATFSLGMLAWFAWYAGQRRLCLAAFYICVALAMLAKGPVAPCLAAAIIVVFALVQRDVRMLLRTLWLPGILLFLLVGLSWYVLVQVRTPQFFRVFILEHNLARFSTNLYHHRQPFWFYLPVLLALLLPWTAFSLAGFVRVVRTWKQVEAPASGADLKRFLLIWALVPVLFFSASQSKLPGYILPAILAWALLAADFVAQPVRDGRKGGGWLYAIHGLLCGLPLAAALLAHSALRHTQPASRLWVVAAAVVVVVFAGVVLTLRAQGLKLLRLVTLAPVLLAVAFLLRVQGPWADLTLSARPVAGEIAVLLAGRSAPVAVFHVKRETEYGLNFYRDQPTAAYERGEIPASDHLLVTRPGAEAELARLVGARRLSHVGSFWAQNLEFYWVSTPPAHSEMH